MNATASQRNPEIREARAFVVNLCASTTPVALSTPEGAEFEGFQFFVTHRREEGRDRYRLHMGYFTSLAAARDKVEDLRALYPMAWAGPAPQGSGAPDAPSIEDTLSGLSNVREVLAALDAGAASATADVLTPIQELSLLESGRLPELHFAVQLVWSERPIDLSTLPQPALFDVYTLYHVEGTRAGKRWYGLRLGFFNEVDAAKRVACYLKSAYSTVVVVPVTVQERECASGDVVSDAPATAAAPAATPSTSDPFCPEPSRLPVRLGHTVTEGPAKPAPFELLPMTSAPAQAPAVAEAAKAVSTPVMAAPKPRATAVAAPVAAPVAGRRPAGKRVMPRRQVEPGHVSPDTATLEVLGASTLTVTEEKPSHAKPKASADDTSSTASRNLLGLAKWFGRRSA